jgi:hypothetical protein
MNLAVRTGRNDEGSTKRQATTAPTDASRLKASGFDLFPRRDINEVGLIR